LYEKIVASAADRFVIIADSTKEVPALSRPLPVEVVPFAAPLIERRLRALGGRPVLRGSPFVTDAGHHIFDVQIDLQTPERLAAQLDAMPGVVEHGLFLGLAHEVLVAHGAQVTTRRP
jgi:ribose 5-phosphate isomerase A